MTDTEEVIRLARASGISIGNDSNMNNEYYMSVQSSFPAFFRFVDRVKQEMADRHVDDMLKVSEQIVENVVREMQWQPIETAPKDAFVLLAGPSGYRTIETVFATGRMCSDYHVGRWIDHANDDLTDWGFRPTHWMPLPESPDLTVTKQSVPANWQSVPATWQSMGQRAIDKCERHAKGGCNCSADDFLTQCEIDACIPDFTGAGDH